MIRLFQTHPLLFLSLKVTFLSSIQQSLSNYFVHHHSIVRFCYSYLYRFFNSQSFIQLSRTNGDVGLLKSDKKMVFLILILKDFTYYHYQNNGSATIIRHCCILLTIFTYYCCVLSCLLLLHFL